MANSTVYPYGTGGSLPSSIGVIDDLTTGGTDKALSAQQGVVIGDYLFGDYTAVDISGETVSDYSLSSSNSKWQSGGKHIALSVNGGDKYRVTISSTQTTGGFYGLFTSYTIPTSTSSSTYYYPACSRTWLNNGTYEIDIPFGVSYLIICTQDGSGKQSTWTIAKHNDAGIESGFSISVGEPIDLSSFTVTACTLGIGKKWALSSSGKGKHIAIPVTAGTAYKLHVFGSTGTGNFFGWLSSYSTPSSGDTIPYVTNSDRIWMIDGVTQTLSAPTGATYLCLVVQNGDGDTSQWEVTKLPNVGIEEAINDYTLNKESIVNNLSQGGTDAPLSAEQGKILNEKIGGTIPYGMTSYPYSGKAIKIVEEHRVAKSKLMDLSGNTSPHAQGGDCWGDWFFQFVTNNSVCRVYNLSTKELVQTATISQTGFVSNCHGNTVCFGSEYYDSGDEFPLIYVSTGYNDGANSGALVYRIVRTEENSTSTFAFTLVQTIKLPTTGWTEFVTAGDVCYVCYTSSRIIYRFKMPLLSDGDVTLDLEDALSSYQFTPQPAWFNGSRNQDRLYHNGKIYAIAGVPTSEKLLLMVLDLATCTRETIIDFATFGISSEPESIFIHDGHLCIAFVNQIAVFYFD